MILIHEVYEFIKKKFRFCIKVRVMDNTDSAIFVIFDKDASSLFDLSCADMVQALETVCVIKIYL
jgi:hypothetical protein